MALKDLLAALPADTVFKVGDKEMSLADYTTAITGEFDTIGNGRTELEARIKQISDERDAAIAAAALRKEPEREPDTRTPEQIAQDALLALVDKKNQYNFQDPYSTQLLSLIRKELKDAIGAGASKADLDELKTGVMGTAAMALMLQMNSEFGKYKWPDGYDASKAWGEAIKNGYVNPQTRLPDMGRFNDQVMQPTRLKEAELKAREEGIEEGRRLAREEQRSQQTNRGRLGLVPRPGSGPTGGTKKPGQSDAPRSLGEAIDRIEITDADIAANTGLRVG